MIWFAIISFLLIFFAAMILVAMTDSGYWVSGVAPLKVPPEHENWFARSGAGMIHWIAFEDMFDPSGKQINDWQTVRFSAVSHIRTVEDEIRTEPTLNFPGFIVGPQPSNDWARCFLLQGYPMWVPIGGTGRRFHIDPQRLDRRWRQAIGMHVCPLANGAYPDPTTRAQWGKHPMEAGAREKFMAEFYGPPAAHIAYCMSHWQMPGQRPKLSAMSPAQKWSATVTPVLAVAATAGAISTQRTHDQERAAQGLPPRISPVAAIEVATIAYSVGRAADRAFRLTMESAQAHSLNPLNASLEDLYSTAFHYPPSRWPMEVFPAVAHAASWYGEAHVRSIFYPPLPPEEAPPALSEDSQPPLDGQLQLSAVSQPEPGSAEQLQLPAAGGSWETL